MLLGNDFVRLGVGCLTLLGLFTFFVSIFVFAGAAAHVPCLKAWLRSYLAGLNLPLRLVKLPPQIAVSCIESQILASECCLDDPDLTLQSLQEHCEAGGDVLQVVRAMIEAQRRGVPLSFREATAIDISGKSVMEAS